MIEETRVEVQHSPKVLVVEDNPLNMKLFSVLITAQGYDVLQAPDGVKGLELAREHHPDLILMDMQLPGISGLDVTRILKDDERTRSIPVVVTTAHIASGDDARIRECGCDGFLAKPIAISEFLSLIDSFLTGKMNDS